MAGLRRRARIVPFRGEYYELTPEQRRDLVNGLIYPVPDPQFPFLGVHLTRMIDGSVHAGPNAVLATRPGGLLVGSVPPARRGRGRGRTAACGGWPANTSGTASAEVRRSLSRKRFAQSLARLVPALTRDDIVPAGAGVRAQAIAPDGSPVDDFLILRAGQVHVLNAPSPAATSSLEIARYITTTAKLEAAETPR